MVTMILVLELPALAVWVRLLWVGIRHLLTQRGALLNAATAPATAESAVLPMVSILVPARNEERSLRECLSSLLALDYPRYEVIFVNDHSADRTGEIARDLGSGRRLRYMDAPELPAGWAGKNWALHNAALVAKGDLLLMTDADICHHPLSLRRAVEALQARRVDIVSLLPQVICRSFWERVMMPIFGMLVTTRAPIYASNDPSRSTVIVAGGFILIRRDVYEAVGGHEAIRGEIVEDLSLGALVKSRGYRLWTTGTEDLIWTRMYYGLSGVWSGLSKNFYAHFQYSPARVAAALALLTAVGLVPPASLASFLTPASGGPARTIAVVLVLMMYAGAVGTTRKMHIPLYASVAFPAGCLLYMLIGLNSFRHAYTGGPAWKGRRYGTIGPRSRAACPER
ncbi:MAG: glycosyltransferase [Acidobacteria bacterium]|nr:glycosyltransferase [Acidobacteriota bacterium]